MNIAAERGTKARSGVLKKTRLGPTLFRTALAVLQGFRETDPNCPKFSQSVAASFPRRTKSVFPPGFRKAHERRQESPLENADVAERRASIRRSWNGALGPALPPPFRMEENRLLVAKDPTSTRNPTAAAGKDLNLAPAYTDNAPRRIRTTDVVTVPRFHQARLGRISKFDASCD
ncbi:hypothetical protein HPB47_006241 [Ixodes persulcatus]|uniref:Uncharacterized protein n=1 Tax=Ixodes persulcatus TaxID=34615 RepID=A0AC60PB29_IXOPE|nr:hypothetical protein HPB47_006241 [Ixodes persulcatus]